MKKILIIIIAAGLAVGFIGFAAAVIRPDEVITVPPEPVSYYMYPQADTRVPQPVMTTAEAFKPFPVPLDAALQEYINAECEARGVPTSLAIAVIWRESRYAPGLISETADYGLMQVHVASWPDLIKTMQITDILNDYQNCKIGVAILARAWYQAGGDVNMAAMAYKAPGGCLADWAAGVYSTPYSRSVAGKMAELEAAR